MNEMKQVTQKNAVLVEESAAYAAELVESAGKLRTMVAVLETA
ncbi:hypothetical protein ACJ1_44850 [Pantoea sp. QMID1]|nr:hypothetical protein ACJ1_44850 [Pantoea sp. QMID1]